MILSRLSNLCFWHNKSEAATPEPKSGGKEPDTTPPDWGFIKDVRVECHPETGWPIKRHAVLGAKNPISLVEDVSHGTVTMTRGERSVKIGGSLELPGPNHPYLSIENGQARQDVDCQGNSKFFFTSFGSTGALDPFTGAAEQGSFTTKVDVTSPLARWDGNQVIEGQAHARPWLKSVDLDREMLAYTPEPDRRAISLQEGDWVDHLQVEQPGPLAVGQAAQLYLSPPRVVASEVQVGAVTLEVRPRDLVSDIQIRSPRGQRDISGFISREGSELTLCSAIDPLSPVQTLRKDGSVQMALQLREGSIQVQHKPGKEPTAMLNGKPIEVCREGESYAVTTPLGKRTLNPVIALGEVLEKA